MTDEVQPHSNQRVCVDINFGGEKIVSSGLYIRAFEINQFCHRIQSEGYDIVGFVWDESNTMEVITDPIYGSIEGAEHSAVMLREQPEGEEE